MSAGGVAAIPRAAEQSQLPAWKEWFDRFTPSQGWASVALLMAVLAVVVESVASANWVATPGIVAVLVLSAVAGLLLAKVRAPAVVLHPVGIALGLVVVVLLTASLAEEQGLVKQVQEEVTRLKSWFDQAKVAGVSTDMMPISFILLGLTWTLGYASSWFVFRGNNAWVTVVLAGLAILSNLSFLPYEPAYTYKFFVFLFFAMLLVVRMRIIQNHVTWDQARIKFSPISGWQTIHAAIWFSLIAVLLAAFLPLRVLVSYEVAGVWGAARRPVVQLEELFTRLTSGIPCRRDFGCEFGKNLPFTGKVAFGDEVIFQANTSYPSYWLSQTYSEYTGGGWIAGDSTALELGPDTVPPPRGDSLKRVPVNQSLRVKGPTSEFMSGGSIDWMSRPVVAETLSPKRYEIDLRDSTNDSSMPKDLQKLASTLRENLSPPPNVYLEAFISRALPSDLVLIQVDPANAASARSVRTVTVERKEPSPPEIASWKFADGLRADESYSMVSYVSVATDADLRTADIEYTGFIKDHYLQLPSELPQRVRRLADSLVKNARTPLDKALMIQSYLRGPELEYSLDIERPPRSADGVDHFLFRTKKGYSSYFASAMAVMLRAVGVPTRMVAGYAPGEFDGASAVTIVKDSDSHGWVQVYFPKYGWIDFEPTSKFTIPARSVSDQVPLDSSQAIPEEFLEGMDPNELDPLELEPGFSGTGLTDITARLRDPGRLLVPIVIAVVVLALAWIILGIMWSGGPSRGNRVEKAYSRMSRLGGLAGIKLMRHQTPLEYAGALGGAVRDAGPPAQRIAWAFAAHRYGQRELRKGEQKELDRAWKSIRGRLLAKALGRLVKP